MITSAKMSLALQSVHRVIIVARSNAYQNADTQEIATMLDQAEYLLSLIMDREIETEEFRRILKRLGEQFPHWFGRLLEEFDQEDREQNEADSPAAMRAA